jgi:hypothetical protein
MLKFILTLIVTINIIAADCQDLSSNIFFDNQLNVNPAFTGTFSNQTLDQEEYLNTKRIINICTINKWSGSQSPYTSGFATFLWRLSSFNMDNPDGLIPEVPFSISLTGMYDKSMLGIMKSTYVSLSSSYHQSLTGDNDNNRMSLGIGFSATYSNRVADLNNISFSEQFQSGGFDLTLPNGEYTMNDMKSYVSLASGLLFSLNNGYNKLRLGVSCLNFNRPKNSYNNNQFNVIPFRYTTNLLYNHVNRGLTYSYDLYSNFQQQAGVKLISIGGMINKFIIDQNESINRLSLGLGCNYQSNKTLTPCLRLQAHKYQVTATYDVLTDKESGELSKTKSYGIFFQYLF